ncbi:tripartite tricarboxylate transporter permease [Azospirillum sp. RWY-5-1]|uniref:Tripartite tricarboxylate transporter permease n=1 Tax=Azospirillum oleiclasticum TaxID=2735135 RepID=A0ABX2TIY6_9PROT|nr:tripartite tricarboxylate transporter permease [Azospirillum oleiclasticum]NYZ14537.1 tripartite tricarboxylate transporter permease [Azospirillum oleiclasticum]NYZ24315.1 tripartite tricarboxylate transporter permease [Azospirillum oleiclasticum]
MDVLANLMLGFSTAATPENLLYCLLGTVLGTAVGVLPGLGPSTTIALLLPFTFTLGPTPSLIMLAGIYYGAQYGGSTTAILLNLPGEPSSAVTALDGYQMARQGRAGHALAIAATSSFAAGTLATFVIVLFAPVLSSVALEFGPAEYFSLVVLGLIFSVALAHGSAVRALAMVVFGLLLSLVGNDVTSGEPRFTFGRLELADGINFVTLSVGFFGIAEILRNLETEGTAGIVTRTIGRLLPSRADLRACVAPIARGTAIGSLLGILPGGGALLSSFASYTLEKKLSDTPGRFGQGAIEGVAGPEAANNAGAQTSFIPMLTLGLPANAVMAMMVGAMVIQGIVPGPNVMTERPALFWGLIASMWIGNLMLLVLNLPLVGVWARLMTIPYTWLFPAILTFSAIGIYSLNGNVFDLYALCVSGVLGYVLLRLGCEPAPFLLGFVLGPMLEEHMRRAMLLSFGNPAVFVTRPISAGLLLLALLALLAMAFPAIAKKRNKVFVE